MYARAPGFSYDYVLRSHKITMLVANDISKQILWLKDRTVYESNLSTQNSFRKKLWPKISKSTLWSTLDAGYTAPTKICFIYCA